jgi:hypothetical protein
MIISAAEAIGAQASMVGGGIEAGAQNLAAKSARLLRLQEWGR